MPSALNTMSPALREPLRNLSRSPLRSASSKASDDAVDEIPQTPAPSEEGSQGDSLVPLSSTQSQEGSGSSTTNEPPDPPPIDSSDPNSISRIPSVASISTTRSQCSDKLCKWKGCDVSVDEIRGKLLAHIHEAHVQPQLTSNNNQFTCMWQGCKVYGRVCINTNWLSRHVQAHSEVKGKPFSCMFSGCFRHFSSSEHLQRHIDRDHSRLTGPIQCKNGSKVANPFRTKRRKRVNGVVYRTRRSDFLDARTCAVLQSHVVMDRLLSGAPLESLVEAGRALPAPLPPPLPSAAEEQRELRSTPSKRAHAAALSARSPCRVSVDRLKVLLTTPFTFVGQRVNAEGKTDYLVKWHGDMKKSLPPVTWIPQEEFYAANAVDNQ